MLYYCTFPIEHFNCLNAHSSNSVVQWKAVAKFDSIKVKAQVHVYGGVVENTLQSVRVPALSSRIT